MRPTLFVGCGGSGGVTLQFLMDQLRADLQQRGIDRLPGGWQFVHVDVPVEADGVREGLPPVVKDQGGSYAGLATLAGNYPDVADVVERQLEGEQALAQLATWRADPATTRVPVTKGAGQMRAVGRLVTLSGLHRVRRELEAAFARLQPTSARNELAEVALRFSPRTAAQATAVDDKPTVIIVSSMAGGAGASMVLDVCRLLTQVPEYEPETAALFLYTPEVFGRTLERSAVTGVEGNAMAMLGELVATQLGAGVQDDREVFRALGMSGVGRAGLPFGRVFPIGATIGASGAVFGDGSLDGIYRGVGRGLAALVLAGGAHTDFINYEITNSTPRRMSQRDLGWAVEPKDFQWGTFGFASLALGRDRYAEYAAQRIARSAVDRLVRGHERPGDHRPAGEQVASLADIAHPDFVARVGLPGSAGIADWYGTVANEQQLAQSESLAVAHVDPRLRLTAAVDARQWVPVVLHQVAQDTVRLNRAADDASYAWGFEWYRGLLDRMEIEVEELVVRHGLPVARTVLERVAGATDAWVQELRYGAAQTQRDVTALPADVLAQAQALTGTIDGRHGVLQSLRQGYRNVLYYGLSARNAELAAGVLASLRVDLVEPLMRACDEALGLLRSAVAARPSSTGLARLTTDEYAAWPVESDQVPRRFRQAHNEVLLTGTEEFGQRFESHLAASMQEMAPGDVLPTVVSQVIRHEWPTVGTRPEGRLLRRAATWRPPALPHDPASLTREVSTQRVARYELATRPAEVLERAREWIRRPEEPFSLFVSQSLSDYVSGVREQADETVLAQRRHDLLARFGEALSLARPLVGVNQRLVAELHEGDQAEVRFRFSNAQLHDQELEERLVAAVVEAGGSEASEKGLQAALRTDVDAARIDVFGSYAPLNPAAFTSLLSPLANGWAAANTSETRRSFWERRRTRRLPAGLPMGERQRRALVGGWYVARVTGRLRMPDEYAGGRAVQVFDDHRSEGQWLSLPDPLIVPEEELRKTNAMLPAVLLSVVLALVQTGSSGGTSPLQPYTILRRMWDNTTAGLADYAEPGEYAASEHLRAWVRGAPAPAGAPAKQATGNRGSAEDNRLALLKRVSELRDQVAEQYLPPGAAPVAGRGRFAVVRHVEDLPRVPLFHEVAADAYACLDLMARILDELGDGAPTEIDL